jgi:hypothetical protein
VPWEDPRRPRLRSWLATLAALSEPERFFGLLPWRGGLRAPLSFAVLSSTVGACGSSLFGLLSALGMSASLEPLLQAILAAAPPGQSQAMRDQLPALVEALHTAAIRMQLASLLLAPLSALLHALVISALTHPLARWLGGKGSFEATFRVVGYAAGARALDAVPGLGALLALVCGVLLTTVGLRRAHGLGTGRALVLATWWIPLGALFLLALAAAVAAVVMARFMH